MKKTFFYIIQRDGLIFEIEFTPERFSSSFEQWQKGGLLVFPSLGAGINAADIKNILNAEQYENYISSVKPKEYIKNGTWRDGKEHGVVRHEPWKQIEVDKEEEERNKYLLPETEGERENRVMTTAELFKKYRPKFMDDQDVQLHLKKLKEVR